MQGALSIALHIALARAQLCCHTYLQRPLGDVVQLWAQEEEGMVLGDSLCHEYFLRHLGNHSEYGTAPAIMASRSS